MENSWFNHEQVLVFFLGFDGIFHDKIWCNSGQKMPSAKDSVVI